MTKVITCTCQHQFQDATYGKQQRVANTFKNKAGVTINRCTVCKREHSVGTR